MASTSMVSFNSPGDAANGCRRPASILLNEKAYIANFRIDQPPDIADDINETTATAKSKGGHTMAVSFWVADPPDMSFFSVVCSKPADCVSKRPGFRISPHVVGAEGRFVLLRARFLCRYGKDERFMYTAGGTESPSLERVPLLDDDDHGCDLNATVGCLHGVKEFGIVPRGLHYLVAALCDSHDSSLDYQLHVYSSESKTWSTMVLPNTMVKTIKPEKVITLGEGVLGWVDFSHGLLVCNLFQEQLPSPRFIPLPRPLPGNKDKLRIPGAPPRLFRDLTCVDGKLKFIEMEHGTEKPSDPCDDDVLYDSDLIRLLEEDMDGKPKSRHGWRTVTWSRTVSSNCWCKECVVDVADILVDESAYSLLLSGLTGETAGKLKFRDLYCVFPTLSIDNGDILHLKSSVEPSDRNGWVVTVDLGNKKVKALRAYPFQKHDFTKQAFRTSTLSCHLVITPGIKVSAYRKITQVGKSANSPNSASICVDKHVSWNSRTELQRLLDDKLEKLKRERDAETQTSMQNDQSRAKQQRLLAEKITLPLNKAPSIVQNDHISQVDPVQNNLPPQQCFNKWDQPCDPGCSSYPQQNNLLPQQCFNMLNGFCGYAPLAPAPVLQGYVSYQPLWHQPPPWRQQQPCSEFEPHKASQPCFNKHNGARYHGYLQQLPAPNSVAYGTHSVYGSNQQQLQSLRPIYNLPASGSWQQPPSMQLSCNLVVFGPHEENLSDDLWCYLCHHSRAPPAPVTMERFCLKLVQGDTTAAISCVSRFHQEGKIQNTSSTSWLNLLNRNADRLKDEHVTKLVHELNNFISSRSSSDNISLYRKIQSSCTVFLSGSTVVEKAPCGQQMAVALHHS